MSEERNSDVSELKANDIMLGGTKYMDFTIRVCMRKRWVPHFLAMLKKMQQYGGLGCSRYISIYSDGDGDFNPKFKWAESLPDKAEPVNDEDGNVTYDAG